MGKIVVKIKTVYGKDLIYPVCDKAKLFASLTRKSTLDTYDLSNISRLGFTIEQAAFNETLLKEIKQK